MKLLEVPGSKPKIKRNWIPSGYLADNEKITIAIRIRKKTSSEKRSDYLEKLGNKLPKDKKHYTRKRLQEEHGAEENDIFIVHQFASEHNLKVEDSIPALRMITLSGRAIDINGAFKINLEYFSNGDYYFFSHKEPLLVPEYIAPVIKCIYGLDNQPLRIPNSIPLNIHPIEADSYTPIEVAKAYNFPQDVTGKGQSIGIIALGGGYNIDDIKFYLENILNVPVPTIIDVSVDGAKNNPGVDGKYDMEIVMSLEIMAAIAHGAKFVVYFAERTELGFFNAISRAVFDEEHKNNIISITWGKAECLWKKSMVEAFNGIFQAAALLGITICVPSGDDGADDGMEDGRVYVDFPASSPYVLSCGGTILKIENNKIKQEVVWREKEMGKWWATGGGVSDLFNVPEHQQNLGISIKSVNPEKNSGRYVPDISGMAGFPGYNTYMNRLPTPIPGGATSAVVPLWAALIALLNEKLGCPVGYINPLLYNSAKNLNERIKTDWAFNDITFGTNDLDKLGGYHAGLGWDACTGLGSPNGENLVKLLDGR